MNSRNTLRACVSACVAVCLLSPAYSQVSSGPSLRGTISDPSGALVPSALVQLRGPGGEQRTQTDAQGQYIFATLRPGKYQIRVIAKGFTVAQRPNFEITTAATLDVQLTIEAEAQVVNVEEEANRVSTDPASNGGALVLGEKELEALSDDPDELAQQLQALAGPAAGPNGGQIYIDGFTGGQLPPKGSIREVRVNSNPFAAEYDRPGFGRIEIFTKPGSDTIRGQAFFQFNNESLNSRSPLLSQSTRPPFEQRFYGLNLSGPIKKQKASFGFDFERRNIDENALILATDVSSSFTPQTINQAVVTPQVRTTFSPRIDYSINPTNTLVMRYQNTRTELDNEGVGNFSLATRAYKTKQSENTFQLTETATLSARAITETRFQYQRSNISNFGDGSTPAISVAGAFDGGGAPIGLSGNTTNHVELSNITTFTRQTHTFKWGARLRQSFNDDTSYNNFAGTYTFFGGTGPQLDANNQAIPGTSIDLSALERYRRTLLFQQLGYSAALIRQLGGGASQFSRNNGTASLAIHQFDIGLFFGDDWRLRPNLTLSYGLRYETQTNIHDWSDLAPRFALAWGIDSKRGKPGKTVLRAGFGVFYDRIADSATLQSERYNGVTQQSYLLINPDTFPAIPSNDVLAASRQPQQLQYLYSDIRAPRNYQTSVGIDRQINSHFRLSANYVNTRGVHLQRTRNINAPVGGVYPFGDPQLRILTESTGFSRTNQLIVSPNVNYKKIFLFGFYSLSYGRSDAEGMPADPNNLRAEWGPSSFGDVRHRFLLGTSVPLPFKFSISPFLFASSGTPYNITTGRDTNSDGFTSERPALVDVAASSCGGGSLVYEPSFGCFNLNPAPGTPTISRNYGRGPATVNFNLRLARTWSFGRSGESGPQDGGGPPPGMGGVRGPGGPGGPGPGGPGGGGPPRGMFGANSGKKYNLMLSISARNILNHANFAPPSGDLSSPYFGQYRTLAGFGPFGNPSTYNRKIDVQLRFTF